MQEIFKSLGILGSILTVLAIILFFGIIYFLIAYAFPVILLVNLVIIIILLAVVTVILLFVFIMITILKLK